jgi:hypothetical protein
METQSSRDAALKTLIRRTSLLNLKLLLVSLLGTTIALAVSRSNRSKVKQQELLHRLGGFIPNESPQHAITNSVAEQAATAEKI